MLYWATSRCCKCQSSCSQLLRSGALLGSFFPMVLLASRYRCSAWQFLPDGALRRPCHYAAVHLHLCHGASASNKPHSAEKSTPVWLAVWRIWAGFANSQIGMRPLPHLIIYVRILFCCHVGLLLRHSKSVGPSAPIAYATSVSPPNEAIAWLGRWYPMGDEAAAWPGRSCRMANDATSAVGKLFCTDHGRLCRRAALVSA